jgi:methylated-DNA-[protein]-cysteine S-methyltransferase
MTSSALRPHSWVVIETDLGAYAVGGDDDAVRSVLLPHPALRPLAPGPVSEVVTAAAAQMAEFLDGRRTSFDVPVASSGTAFQEDVWAALAEIPFGETRTYKWVAEQVGRPRATRAVGQALGRNPVPILRACHRVLPTGRGLGGYAGGLGLKTRLLDLEAGAR